MISHLSNTLTLHCPTGHCFGLNGTFGLVTFTLSGLCWFTQDCCGLIFLISYAGNCRDKRHISTIDSISAGRLVAIQRSVELIQLLKKSHLPIFISAILTKQLKSMLHTKATAVVYYLVEPINFWSGSPTYLGTWLIVGSWKILRKTPSETDVAPKAISG